jgi:hypothetical protein
MSDIRKSCDTLVESLQRKEGLSRQLHSCVARCEACASINDYEVNASRIASVGMKIVVVLNHLKKIAERDVHEHYSRTSTR